MKHVMVRYKVKPELAAQNERMVRSVYEELQQSAPAGLRYATFVQEDGVSFVHVASFSDDIGDNPLGEVAAFRAFTEKIASRCDEPPLVIDLRQIGSYGRVTA